MFKKNKAFNFLGIYILVYTYMITLEEQNNKYKKWYFNIINYRLKNPLLNQYTETHHIIPKSLGGTDENKNLVELTAREHYICHLLLTAVFPTSSLEYKKMWKAFALMAWYKSKNQERNYKINNRIYEKLKTEFSKIQSFQSSGILNSGYGKKWYHNVELQQSNKFYPTNVPNGWDLGRVINWKKYFKPKFKSIEIKCLHCNNIFLPKTSVNKFCCTECADSHSYEIGNKIILLERNGIKKETKRENLHAYKKCGWKLVDRLYK